MLKGTMTTKTNFDLSLYKMNSEAYHFIITHIIQLKRALFEVLSC